jgi:DNA-binding response OmpR family regulator
VPVIILEGPTEETDTAALLRRGAHACLRKPFEMARLLAEVRTATSVRNVA